MGLSFARRGLVICTSWVGHLHDVVGYLHDVGLSFARRGLVICTTWLVICTSWVGQLHDVGWSFCAGGKCRAIRKTQQQKKEEVK